MVRKFTHLAVTVVIALVSGCATSPPPLKEPSSQVQLNFNFTPENQTAPKHYIRGAMSGVPQHVGFYYSVNPDCSSGGLVQLQLQSPPTHGSVEFAKADGYTNFPSTSAGYECNGKKSPGMEIVYTSAKDFIGTDQFTVQGIGPRGKYMETVYSVRVIGVRLVVPERG